MKKFKLNKTNLNYIENLPINIREIKESSDSDVKQTIQNFHDLYTWKKMFTIDDVENRLNDGCRFFLFYLNDLLVGHAWFCSKPYSYMGTKKKYHFPNIFSFNVFVSKIKHNKELFDSFNYYSYCVKELIDDGYLNFFIEIDDWNSASINFFTKVGFTEY